MTVQRTRFDNGLTLVTEELRSAPVVAVQAWVNVGSADEIDEIAGIAHVHEHMLFKGTKERGIGQIARTVEAAGGEINAWTSYDQTVYHVVLAADEVETGVDILADALRNSSFDADELARETEVIVEEIRRADDIPSRRIAKTLFGLAYTAHPYRRPVIGSEATVRALTRQRIIDFFTAHYRPDNITVIATGDFETARLVDVVRRHLGDWSAPGPAQRLTRPVEPRQERARVHVLREAVKEGRLALAWHIPGLCHEDIAAIDVLSVVLGHGDSSRLQAETRRARKLVNDVYAYAYTPRDPGLFMVGAGLPSQQAPAALASILEQLYALRREHVTREELEKAKVIILSESAYQRETVQGEARKLGFFEVVAGDYAFEQAYLERLRALTPEDVRRAASIYFDAAPTLVVQQPPELAAVDERVLEAVIESGWRAAQPRPPLVTKPGELGVTRVDLDNGATILVRPEESPVVAMRAVALGGLLWETPSTHGIGNLLASVWGMATLRLSTDELAQRVAGLGGHLAAFSGRNSIGLRAEFIREKGLDGLQIFLDALLQPVITATDLERERAVVLERIRNREDNPAGVAFDQFAAAIYPGHPYGWRMTGTEESVGRLALADLLAYQKRYAAPDKLVVSVVGGMEAEQVIAALSERLAQPKSSALEAPPALGPALAPERQVRYRLQKHQTHVIIGGRGTTIDHPDRFVLEVLTTALSGQSGRLFLDLRDRRSLAYSVSASSVEGLQPGHVLVHMGTSPEKVEQALAGLNEHLERLRQDLVGPEELVRAKRHLVGTHAIDLQRAGSRATVMALGERFGLGYAAHRQYPEHIRAVTAEDVREVARRYLDPARMVEVIVGP